jgi:hypothetical protein
MWRGYQIAQSIQIPPVLVDNFLVVAGNNGSIMVLNPATASQYWSTTLLSGIAAAPAAGNGAVYVAGLDQHVRAFDIATGRTLWKKITEEPLRDPPSLIGDRLYEHIPSQGLVCFDALPADSPGGKILWRAPAVSGNVLFQRGQNLYVWDARARKMTIIERGRGDVVSTLDLPPVAQLLSVLTLDGKHTDLYGVSDEGRVVRLVPQS